MMLLAACGSREEPSSAERDLAAPTPARAVEPPPAAQPADQPLPAPTVRPDATTTPTSSDTIPAAFHGRWGRSAAECARPHDLELAVSADRLRFWESEGRVERVADAGARTVRVAARFTGEGESWTADNRLALSDDGARLTVTGAGGAIVRVRCG